MKYIVKRIGRSVEVSAANSSVLVYRIPYQDLASNSEESIPIKNRFIVYILHGKSESGKDTIYVGKSKNGLKNRPTAHGNNWICCYILTQLEERSFFNDGTIQYIEDKISRRIDELNHFDNTTQLTNTGTANKNDEEDCDDYLERAYQMLDILGLDLYTHYQDSDSDESIIEDDSKDNSIVPDGIYTMSRKLKRWNNKTAKGKMQVLSGKYILLKGSDVCPNEGPGLIDAVRIKRQQAKIANDKLEEDIVFNSPSGAAEFVIAGAANGWTSWKTSEGKPMDVFRQ